MQRGVRIDDAAHQLPGSEMFGSGAALECPSAVPGAFDSDDSSYERPAGNEISWLR
jgi:hypothetical protein